METLPVTLGVRVRRSAFKKGSIPRAVAMPSHSSHSSRLSTSRAPKWGAPVLPSSCYCWRSVTSWGLALFSHRSASRIFIMQPSCSPPPTVTQDDDRRPHGGEERARPWPPSCPQLQGCSSSVLGRRARRVGSRLRVGSGLLLPSVFGGEGRSPPVVLSAAACLAPRPRRLWRCFRCRLLPLGRSVATHPPCGCRSHNTSYAVRAAFVFWDSLVLAPVARTGVRTCWCALGRPPFAAAVLVGRWPLSSVLRWW
jgi:hypothetical protein